MKVESNNRTSVKHPADRRHLYCSVGSFLFSALQFGFLVLFSCSSPDTVDIVLACDEKRSSLCASFVTVISTDTVAVSIFTPSLTVPYIVNNMENDFTNSSCL